MCPQPLSLGLCCVCVHQVVVHVAGKFHVEGRLGIPEALDK